MIPYIHSPSNPSFFISQFFENTVPTPMLEYLYEKPFLFFLHCALLIYHMSQLKAIKQQNNLDGLLIADDKGFQIHNSGFPHGHHLHSLKQLSNYFFPSKNGTVIGIQTTEYTVIVREAEDGKMIATRQAKEGL